MQILTNTNISQVVSKQLTKPSTRNRFSETLHRQVSKMQHTTSHRLECTGYS